MRVFLSRLRILFAFLALSSLSLHSTGWITEAQAELKNCNELLTAGNVKTEIGQALPSVLTQTVDWKTSRKPLKDLGIQVENLEWRKSLIKDPSQTLNEQTLAYMEAVTASLSGFDALFNSRWRWNWNRNHFDKMLQEQNKLVVTWSMPGGKGYSGYRRGQIEPTDHRYSAGRFRTHLVSINISDYFVRDNPRDYQIGGWINCSGLEKIPDHGKGRNVVETKTDGTYALFHIYPQAEYLPVYRARMFTLLSEIRSSNGLSQDELLLKIADYYQVGINSHLFSRVNNSLLMSQVNYLLVRMGLRPMSHWDLDLAAITHDSPKYRAYFLNEVMKAQAL